MASPKKKWLRMKAREDEMAEVLLATAVAVAGRVDTTAAVAAIAPITASKTTTRTRRPRRTTKKD